MFAYEITYARQNVATGPVFPSIPIGDDVVTGQRDPSMMVSVPRKGDPVCAYNYCTNQANPSQRPTPSHPSVKGERERKLPR